MRAVTLLLVLGAGGCGAIFGADFDGWTTSANPAATEDGSTPPAGDGDGGASTPTDSGGACTCPAGELCSPKGCIKDCAGQLPPLERCGDRCVDLASDLSNCGACGKPCTEPGATCKTGACKVPVTCDTSKVATDPDNCGACGHACLGGTCAAGACQPVQLATLSSSSSLTIDATHVYYTRDNALGSGLSRVDKNGGNKKFLSSAVNAGALAASGTYVYVAPSGFSSSGHAIGRVPAAGGASTPIITLEASRFVGGVVPENGGASLFVSYMGEQGKGAAVYRHDLATSSRIRLGAMSAPNVQGVVVNASITSDATNVYLLAEDATGTAVWRCPKTTTDGCTKLGPTLTGIPESIAVYAGMVFVTTKSSILSGSPGTVLRIDANGTMTTIASNRPHPLGIAADASGVYWAEFGATTNGEGALMRAEHGGTNMKTLTNGIGKPAEIVLDSVAIYVASYDSATQPDAIWKIAK